jgi:hypothetical protein
MQPGDYADAITKFEGPRLERQRMHVGGVHPNPALHTLIGGIIPSHAKHRHVESSASTM